MTQRLASAPGVGHYDLAKLILIGIGKPPAPDADVFEQMAKHGYIRVVEDEVQHVIWVDAPRALSSRQREFFDGKAKEGWSIDINSRSFIESRQRR